MEMYMELYVGLDISQSMTHLCVVDSKGKRIWEGKCSTSPEAITEIIHSKAPEAQLIGMESGALSPSLWHALTAIGLPVVCIEARHAHKTLSEQLNKTDKHDARGIAQLVRTNFFKDVKVKSMQSHQIRTLLGERAQLVGMRTALKNQIRGALKTHGFVVSQSVEKGFKAKVGGIIKDSPTLQKMVSPLLRVLESVEREVQELDKLFQEYAENHKVCRNLMTIPGVGPITAVAFTSAVDDPKRFRKSRSVGAYFGLTNRRDQSGERDVAGRISGRGDTLVRSYLYEAAGIMLTRTKSWSALKSWGLQIAKRSCMNKAKVAVARKLAVIMHQMWLTGEAFRWSETEAAAA
jgi:transposase